MAWVVNYQTQGTVVFSFPFCSISGMAVHLMILDIAEFRDRSSQDVAHVLSDPAVHFRVLFCSLFGLESECPDPDATVDIVRQSLKCGNRSFGLVLARLRKFIWATKKRRDFLRAVIPLHRARWKSAVQSWTKVESEQRQQLAQVWGPERTPRIAPLKKKTQVAACLLRHKLSQAHSELRLWYRRQTQLRQEWNRLSRCLAPLWLAGDVDGGQIVSMTMRLQSMRRTMVLHPFTRPTPKKLGWSEIPVLEFQLYYMRQNPLATDITVLMVQDSWLEKEKEKKTQESWLRKEQKKKRQGGMAKGTAEKPDMPKVPPVEPSIKRKWRYCKDNATDPHALPGYKDHMRRLSRVRGSVLFKPSGAAPPTQSLPLTVQQCEPESLLRDAGAAPAHEPEVRQDPLDVACSEAEATPQCSEAEATPQCSEAEATPQEDVQTGAWESRWWCGFWCPPLAVPCPSSEGMAEPTDESAANEPDTVDHEAPEEDVQADAQATRRLGRRRPPPLAVPDLPADGVAEPMDQPAGNELDTVDDAAEASEVGSFWPGIDEDEHWTPGPQSSQRWESPGDSPNAFGSWLQPDNVQSPEKPVAGGGECADSPGDVSQSSSSPALRARAESIAILARGGECADSPGDVSPSPQEHPLRARAKSAIAVAALGVCADSGDTSPFPPSSSLMRARAQSACACSNSLTSPVATYPSVAWLIQTRRGSLFSPSKSFVLDPKSSRRCSLRRGSLRRDSVAPKGGSPTTSPKPTSTPKSRPASPTIGPFADSPKPTSTPKSRPASPTIGPFAESAGEGVQRRCSTTDPKAAASSSKNRKANRRSTLSNPSSTSSSPGGGLARKLSVANTGANAPLSSSAGVKSTLLVRKNLPQGTLRPEHTLALVSL